MIPEINQVGSWIKENKLRLVPLALAAGLMTSCGFQPAPDSQSTRLPDEISFGRNRTHSGYRISLVYRRGRNPVFCGDGEPLKNTIYQVRSSNLVVTRGPNLEISQNEREVKLTPSEACNL